MVAVCSEFHEDLKKLYLQAGVERRETVFLFTDTQVSLSPKALQPS